MKAGDTFRFRARDPHLWIVVSDPGKDAEHVLLVNVTTWRRDKDQSCLLGPEHHESITHNSCIAYEHSRAYQDSHLNTLLASDKIVLQAPLLPAVLQMVREGAASSTRMKLAHGQIVIEQGLVEP